MSIDPPLLCIDVAKAACLGPGIRKGKETAFKCPNHNDHNPSLEIREEKNVWICRACNKSGNAWALAAFIAGIKREDKHAVAAWLKEHGLLNGNTQQDSQITDSYDYTDANGNLIYQVVRFFPKGFKQRRPDGKDGWIWNTKGLKRLPNNLSEIIQAEYIWIVEGEKDVENLRKIGLTATCNDGGAGKWRAELSQYFSSDQSITILPDNDDPGRKHAEQVAANLYGKVASLKILELAGLPDKGDVSDWLQGLDPEGAAEELCRLAEGAPEWEPKQADSEIGNAGVYRNIARDVREYIGDLEGSFSTQLLYSELGITDHRDKATTRKALERMKGELIEPEGDRAGWYRVIRHKPQKLDLENVCTESLDLNLPLGLDQIVTIMPSNLIVVCGGPDSGKTAFLIDAARQNLDKWTVNYWLSEGGPEELRIRLDLADFPWRHKNFNAYERAADFADVIQPGKHVLNIVDFLEMNDEYFKISKYLSDIQRKLRGAVAIVAIQTKTGTNLPLGGDRALEKARLAVSLRGGNRTSPNVATILKCKLRKTQHSMIGKTRSFRLVQGSRFICDFSEWG